MSYKKHIYIYFIGSLLSIYLISCEDAPGPGTRLDFAAGSGLTNENGAVTPGSLISSSLYARTTDGNKFKNFKVIYNYDSTTNITYLDSSFSATTEFSLFFTFTARGIKGNERWIFIIEDENKNTYTQQYILTTAGVVLPINTYTSAYYRQTPFRNLQYFSAEDGTAYPTYTLQGARNPEIKKKVIFGFAPNTLTNTPSDTLVNLITANGTKFKTTTLSTAAFTAINTAADLKSTYDNANSAEITNLSRLSDNQVIAFRTTAGKSGLIQILGHDTVEDKTLSKFVLQRMRYQVKAER